MNLAGKIALVTGGGTGLGRAISLALARQGVHVGVNYSRSAQEAHATVDELRRLGVRALPFQADVSDQSAVRAMMLAVADDLGRLDLLVNNAGVTRYVAFEDLDSIRPEDFDTIFSVNVKGAFLCAQAAAPQLRASGQGRIVNVASTSAFAAEGSSIPYAASKAALVHLTRCLARALQPDVHVNAVAPGWMETRWLATYLPPDRRQAVLTDPTLQRIGLDDVADAVVMLARNESINGETIRLDRGGSLRA